jgi:hypothetical protein
MNFTIWNDQFWLPKNTTWKDFNQLEENGIRVPRISDLLYVYPLAGVLYLARLFFESYIAQPLGRFIGVCDLKTKNQRIDHKLSDKKQKQQHFTRVSPLAKFSESTWRFTFYLGIFLYGLITLQKVKLKRKKEVFI